MTAEAAPPAKPARTRKARAAKPKPPAKWFALSARQVGIYNNWDCLATARLAKHITADMERRGDPAYYAREVWPTIPTVLAMQARGIPLDSARLREITVSYATELDVTERDIRTLTGAEDANFRSPQQRADILFSRLGFKSFKRTKGGSDSTDQEVLDHIYREMSPGDDRRIIVEKLFHRSKVQTIVSRYLEMYPRDGRVFPTIKFCGTVTERLAYARPPIQQFPKQGRWLAMRSAFRASPGCVFVSRDYSQLEARILAVLAHDALSLAAFAEGRDIHVVNALDLFAYTEAVYAALGESQREGVRNYSKSFLYKISYGGRSELLKAKSFCPCELCADDMPPLAALNRTQAKVAGDRWLAKHNAVTRFREALRDRITRFRNYESPLGGRRWVFGPWRDVERTIYNLPMQWIASQIVRRSMRRLGDAGAPLVLNMHDQLVLEVPEREAPQWSDRMQEAMEVPVPELDNTVFPTKPSIAERWNEL